MCVNVHLYPAVWYNFRHSTSHVASYGPKLAAESAHDRTANALMLFYRKKSTMIDRGMVAATVSTEPGNLTPYSAAVVEPPLKTLKLTDEGSEGGECHSNRLPSDLVDGYDAFMREVSNFNTDHAISKQLLDDELHNFILSLLQLVNDSKYIESLSVSDAQQVLHKIVTFATSFFFDVVLHCRDRSNVLTWIEQLKCVYSSHSSLATDFIAKVVGTDGSWFVEYLLLCSDESARNSFVELFSSMLQYCVSLTDTKTLTSMAVEEKREAGKLSDNTILLQECIRRIVRALSYDIFKSLATSAGLLSLVDNLSKIAVFR